MTVDYENMRPKVKQAGDNLYVVCGKIVQTDPGMIDISRDDDKKYLIQTVMGLWHDPVQRAQGMLPFESKTYHHIMSMCGGGREWVHIVPQHIGDLSKESLASVKAILDNMRKEMGV